MRNTQEVQCIFLDSCTAKGFSCDPNAKCADGKCECQDGYKGNGEVCQGKDESQQSRR